MQIAKSTLAKIHVAKKQLGMSDEDYRAMLRSVGGVDSAKDLSPLGANKVLKHLERCGFAPKRSPGRRPVVSINREAQLSKIEALLAQAGRTWTYADAMAKRICKVDRVQFCDGEMLGKLIAALSIDAKRRA
ncbi:gp16 family protein [Burkholderia gladioli]|uniref:gp16 family protein n=1 Tax=Burkholderia gladioli TaxID=28095 RepID=UPI000F524DC9|nr:regulatory protein GemA [Burkholderia gladioli]